MSKKYNVASLRAVSAEGNYSYYKYLRNGRRLFLVAKLLFTSLQFFKNRGSQLKAKNIVYIKGINQLRYHQYVRHLLEKELGTIDIIGGSLKKLSNSHNQLPGFSFSELFTQTTYIFFLLVTGNKRYLSLYFLNFSLAIERVMSLGLKNIETFICYNDQPYDLAAIVSSLNSKCRTITIQHGLILSPHFYFPTNTHEFWAWGELSRVHFRSRNNSGQLVIKGRYPCDLEKKKDLWEYYTPEKPTNILIAPSFYHNEIKELVKGVYNLVGQGNNIKIALKLHPSTKFKFKLRVWTFLFAPNVILDNKNIEELSDEYAVLITKFSTSAIDFFLKGKPVFFLKLQSSDEFPSKNYGNSLNDLEDYIAGMNNSIQKNEARLEFLASSLNI
jgi:hypothetical protein